MTNQEVNRHNEKILSDVNPELARRAWQIIEFASESGYTLVVAEGYRTVKKQNEYYAKGRTKPGNIITYKKGGESKHNHREAVDFDFVINGQRSNSQSNNWKMIGNVARQVGLIWGGDWKKFKDLRHVELPGNYIETEISSYQSPSFSKGTLIAFCGLMLVLILNRK